MKDDDSYHNSFSVGNLMKVSFTKKVVVVRKDAICLDTIADQLKQSQIIYTYFCGCYEKNELS